ncbi:MAG: tRNA dimethylallyltransferase [Nitrosomonas sp.]|nr:MAG: tRNA dimethylallyltransferase [Nitrosomonas sp.]
MFEKETDNNRLDAAAKEDAPDSHLPPAIFMMGPTASGKSQIALEIAERFPVEIVSVDSAQVYRFMDIGTAKPDQATLARIPHHLVNLIDPTGNYSAAQFCSDALDAMRDITRRGKIPLLVGGTMLYFQALLNGLSFLPAADSKLRAAIEKNAKMLGWPAMHARLRELDAESAARIKSTDSQRIQRALEVCMLTSRPMSEILRMPRKIDLPYRVIKLALQPSDRNRLHQRIATRFENMLRQGLIDEVSFIRRQFAVGPELPSMRCVGYRQAWLYLEKEINLQELSAKGVAATRQLAKRQLTWLRSIMRKYEVIEFDCLEDDLSDRVCSFLLAVDIA